MKKDIDRRDFLVSSASLALAAGLGACAYDPAPSDGPGIRDTGGPVADVSPPPAGAVDNLRVVHATDKAMIQPATGRRRRSKQPSATRWEEMSSRDTAVWFGLAWGTIRGGGVP